MTPQELFDARDRGEKIEVNNDGLWVEWHGQSWNHRWEFRIAPKPKRKVKVKMLAWFDGDQLRWYRENKPISILYVRVSSEDKEIEIDK